MSKYTSFCCIKPVLAAASLLVGLPAAIWALGPAPVVLTVPSVPTSPATPHQTWSGNANFTLKGTASSTAPATDSFTYDWNPGDGGAHCTGSITMPAYVLQCAHTYTGSVGTTIKATLTVNDTTNGTSGSAVTYVAIYAPPPDLPVEVNLAIENGLWYLHEHMHRTSSNGLNYGDWNSGDGSYVDSSALGYNSGPAGSNCNAYEASGFLQNTTPVNPYNDDVARCLNSIFSYLTSTNISGLVISSPVGNVKPDQNGNGIAVGTSESYPLYQGGMIMDAIVDANSPHTPVTVATSSPLHGLTGTGTGGAYGYSDVLQDLVDFYVYCQSTGNGFGVSQSGGWRYSCQDEMSDNSPSQWAAIGIIAARRQDGSLIDPNALLNNQAWLEYSFDPTNHWFGYTSDAPLWGPYAVTPSGMVQLAMNGYGRGTTLPISGTQTPIWDDAESFIRDNFGNPASDGSTGSIKDYYYGLYSFTKSMLLHDASGTGLTPTPIQFLRSLDVPANNPIDWYAAQSSTYGGTDPTDGVARTLVQSQIYDGTNNGAWFGNDYDGRQYYFETAFGITMLNRTVFQQVPIACATAIPNPVANGGSVQLNGSCSTEQNPNASITSYTWAIQLPSGTLNISPTNTGGYCIINSCETLKPIAFTVPAASIPATVPVTLTVKDTNNQTSTYNLTVNVNAPPIAPTANAGGPYNFCATKTLAGALVYGPWFVNASKSSDPNGGGVQITSYQWDWACSGAFNSASGVQVEVDGSAPFNTAAVVGNPFTICLKVTDNASILPGNPPNQTAQANAQVTVQAATSENCTHCIPLVTPTSQPTSAHPGFGQVQLLWKDTNDAAFPIAGYDVYRSSSPTFSNPIELAGGNTAAVPAATGAGEGVVTLTFTDGTVIPGQTYYYRIAPVTAQGVETCTSNITVPVTVKKLR